ncbi:MAG: helix-turn-helix transcriptional regulator [Verrucomicrobium sp.]|nr:AraC family transcriptional regulator [Verrucomicrobium sp.]
MNLPLNHPSLLPRLATSGLFTGFREAFHVATGRSLTLRDVSEGNDPLSMELPFATVLQVPVQINGRAFALLELDAIRLTDGEFPTFDSLARQMLDEGSDASALRDCQQAFQQMPTLSRDRLEALRTMLECFSTQLGDLAYRLFLQCEENEPPAVRRARQHIAHHLAQPMCLEEVARNSGVSPFHFCKIFKRFTGLTFTEYVNRARVEHAKKLLLKPFSRVTEVAYDVGFQSLSQFNRSFRRVMDQSPTEFRSQMTPSKKRKPLVSSLAG